ncbi:MAG TPA: ROK family protein [Candidatus Methylomirabilis sp.]|nr:ROK family protein [Candidatus Methylomirabilis sp.]
MPTNLHDRVALGVDVGGSKIAAGLVDSAGSILYQTRVPMPSRGTPEAAFGAVQSAINCVFAANPQTRAGLAGIGLCAPGPLDPRTGVILNPPNVPCWRNFPLADEIRRMFDLAARVDNDGNAAALAEAIWGAGVGHRNVFYATIGTGIGTGIIFDRRIYHGRTGSAAEGGHLSIDYRGPRCGCGKPGCIEALASGPAIARRARDRIAKVGQRKAPPGEPPLSRSKLLALAGGDPNAVTAEIVAEAFRQGDPLAKEVLQETADFLAIWAGNVIDLLEPDIFIFGGGVAQVMSGFFSRILEQLPKWCVNSRCREIPLVLAKYGPDAGIAGAAALCFSQTS